MRTLLIMLSSSAFARHAALRAPGARRLAARFVAGETIEDGIRAAKRLNAAGILATLDYLGESVATQADAVAAADTYIRLITRIVEEQLEANVSLKLTQMGQDIDESFLRDNLGRVLDHALRNDTFVRFDMESSAYTQRTLDVYQRIRGDGFPNAGIVLQSYLKRSELDVEWSNASGVRVRLCKGAYREKGDVAFLAKRDVDRSYEALMQRLLKHGVYPAIATHDEAMIQATRAFASRHNIGQDTFEFQMLYGVRRDLQEQLVEAGYRVRVYVPFGQAWFPYLMRRLAERPANVFFVARAVYRESRFGSRDVT